MGPTRRPLQTMPHPLKPSDKGSLPSQHEPAGCDSCGHGRQRGPRGMRGSRGSQHVSSRVLQPLPDWVRLGCWKSSKHSPVQTFWWRCREWEQALGRHRGCFTCPSAWSYPEQIPLAGRAAQGLLRAWEGRERRMLAVCSSVRAQHAEGPGGSAACRGPSRVDGSGARVLPWGGWRKAGSSFCLKLCSCFASLCTTGLARTLESFPRSSHGNSSPAKKASASF